MAGLVGSIGSLFVFDWRVNKPYRLGEVVFYLGNLYRARLDHLSADSFEENKWEVLGGNSSNGGDGLPRLMEINETVTLESGESKLVQLNAGFNKYDIRTVYAQSDKGDVQISIYDKASGGFCCYQSLTRSNVYDIVNVPCEDKDANKKVYVTLTSFSPVRTTVSLKVKITNLA